MKEVFAEHGEVYTADSEEYAHQCRYNTLINIATISIYSLNRDLYSQKSVTEENIVGKDVSAAERDDNGPPMESHAQVIKS